MPTWLWIVIIVVIVIIVIGLIGRGRWWGGPRA
jgi:hypothetical protein